jgi:hypothetical protein
MNILDTNTIVGWEQCCKTARVKAKPMISLLTDRSVMTKFLLDTLEGREPIGPDAVFCIGQAGDAWQQMPSKLLKSYAVINIDSDGWMECEPKPEDIRECFQITTDYLKNNTDFRDCHGFIRGLWGETVDGEQNLQRFDAGDFIVRGRVDHTDNWIVRRKIFLNTYSFL